MALGTSGVRPPATMLGPRHPMPNGSTPGTPAAARDKQNPL